MGSKVIQKIAVAAMAIACLTVCAAHARAENMVSLTAEEQAYVQSRGSVKMCVDPDWYPYEKIDENGRHWGIAADLIALVAQRTGLHVELVPTRDWQESLSFMANGKCDILSFLNKTEQREQWMSFTDALFSDPSVIIARNEHEYLQNLSALSETAVLPEGTSIEERLRRDYPNINIILVPSEGEVMDAVSSHKADFAVRSLTMAAYTIRQEGFFNLKICGQIDNYENKLSIGVSKYDPMLLQILNKGIASLSQQEVEAIINRHIPITIQQGFDYKLFFILAGVFVVILTAVFLWSMQLKRLNKRLALQKQELAQVRDRLEVSETLYKSFLNASPDAVVISDANGTILVASPSAYALVGMRMEEDKLPGHMLFEFVAPEEQARLAGNLAKLYDGHSPGMNEYRAVRVDGQDFIMEVKSEVIQGANRMPERMVSIVRDITERRKMEEELQRSEETLRQLAQELTNQNAQLHETASYDKLTGVRNRAYLEAYLTGEVERRGKEPMSILLLDLDHFKAVNDAYGHDVGDQVLIHVATTVRNTIRKTDVFARWGGEEFIAYLPGVPIGEAYAAAEKIRNAAEQSPYEGVGKITVSIGVAQYRGEKDINDWIKRADVEMYRAKNLGRNQVCCEEFCS